jgi:hypothetical protein
MDLPIPGPLHGQCAKASYAPPASNHGIVLASGRSRKRQAPFYRSQYAGSLAERALVYTSQSGRLKSQLHLCIHCFPCRLARYLVLFGLRSASKMAALRLLTSGVTMVLLHPSASMMWVNIQ